LKRKTQYGIFAKPTAYQRELGYNTQYGIESYWRFKPGNFVRLGPSVQLLHNREGDLEVVLGFRMKASHDFTQHLTAN